MTAVIYAVDTEVPDTTFTKSTLKQYNGKNGANAYVAVDGIVYDVTLIPVWKGGKHKMGLKAGKDHSVMITKAPHGKTVLSKLPKVGKYITEAN